MSSMVEVLVALALFVLAFVTVVSPLQQGRRSSLECSQRLRALAVANDLVEQQRSLPFEKIVSSAGIRDIYRYTVQVSEQPHLKVLRLQLRWGDDKVLDYGTLISGDSP
jgi:Tfp pilus assembly protein PilV